MAEAFVKTFKRDYVHVNPIPDECTTLLRSRTTGWRITTQNIRIPARLPFAAGVHCVTQTRRVSSLTASTPASRQTRNT